MHIKDPEDELYRLTAWRAQGPAAVTVGLIVVRELRRIDDPGKFAEVSLAGTHGHCGVEKVRESNQKNITDDNDDDDFTFLSHSFFKEFKVTDLFQILSSQGKLRDKDPSILVKHYEAVLPGPSIPAIILAFTKTTTSGTKNHLRRSFPSYVWGIPLSA